MEKENFEKICKKEFFFLVEEYDFKLKNIKTENFEYNIIYKSERVGITVKLERRENCVFILLHRLLNGKIPDYPIFIKRDTGINTFYFDDLLSLRYPDFHINKPDNLEKKLKKSAYLLSKYADDVLKGDFTIFSDLEKIVKGRVESISNRQR